MAKEKDKQSHSELMVDVRAATPDQLQDELVKLKKEQFNLRFQQATGQLEKTARIKSVRRGIARIKTVMREKARDAVARSGADGETA